MNDELKNRRKQAYLINDWDDVNLPYITDMSNISEQVIHFFNTESRLIYPAKSYFVAIIYAKCLEQWFNIPFYEALNDNDLLPDDKWFVTYENDKETYDKIIYSINDIWNYESINKTVEYFKKEFLINGINA